MTAKKYICVLFNFIFLITLLESCRPYGQSAINPNSREEFNKLTYIVPLGWTKSPQKPYDKEVILKPLDDLKESHSYLSITYCRKFDSRYPKSQDGCADSYKSAIASLKDEDINVEKKYVISIRDLGETNIYRYYSEYYGDNLVCFVLLENEYICIELNNINKIESAKYESIFKDFLLTLDHL